jgi:hypothetical protein
MDEIKHRALFDKEYELLVNAKKLFENKDLSLDVLSNEYLSLTRHFETLLTDFVKILKVSDINERKLYHAKEQINEQKEELEKIIANNKILTGMLPICASCKKIRDDKGYWQHVESYISEHTEAEFSHGLCEECAHKLYPEYFKDKAGG